MCTVSLKEAKSAQRVGGLRCGWEAAGCLFGGSSGGCVGGSASTGRGGLLPRLTDSLPPGPLTWSHSGLLRPPWPSVCCVHSVLFPAPG